ncbi:MAG: AbrB/MazE/SpoVT family DNA-binding domain-containing protein [Deltaproteobacteria bacterium]|nr:AbrB/MazE/SpoVT family DNA-binding domain-containing protein [Deltaproteobacteria bacterium]
MLAKKTSKNQVTLPKEIVRKFPNIDYFDVLVEEGKVIMIPVKVVPATSSLESIREKMRKLGVREDDVSDAVSWARKKKNR